MRRNLTAVGEVVEFVNIREQREVLEERLDSMVQPRLTDAITNRKVLKKFSERSVMHCFLMLLAHVGIFNQARLQFCFPVGCQVFMTNYYFILNKNGNGKHFLLHF